MDIVKDHDSFRRARLAAVTGPLGDAALVGTSWIEGATTLDGFPGRWDLDPIHPLALRYTPSEPSTVMMADAPVREPILVEPAAGGGGTALQHGPSVRATVLHWPGLGLAVRLWDDVSAATLADIDAYPFDDAWRIEGAYTALDRTVGYQYRGHGGRLEERMVVGDLTITVAGERYALLLTRNAAGLTAVFGDATNGRETYGGGRFVPVMVPDAGPAVVDFNRATLPPCAFSPHFDCPLPPPANVIRSPVPAGERRLIRR